MSGASGLLERLQASLHPAAPSTGRNSRGRVALQSPRVADGDTEAQGDAAATVRLLVRLLGRLAQLPPRLRQPQPAQATCPEVPSGSRAALGRPALLLWPQFLIYKDPFSVTIRTEGTRRGRKQVLRKDRKCPLAIRGKYMGARLSASLTSAGRVPAQRSPEGRLAPQRNDARQPGPCPRIRSCAPSRLV